MNGFYQFAFRIKVYHSLEELQAGLDAWLEEYNHNLPHSGRYRYGKISWQTFLDALPIAREKMIGNQMTV